jgi:hypothetical protein
MWSEMYWSDIVRKANGCGLEFIHEQVLVGNLRHLNIE